MKNKLFLIAFIGLLSVNVQASSVEEIIKENQIFCAIAGYVIGTVSYNFCTSADVGRVLTFHFNYGQETKSHYHDEKKVSEVHGVDFLGCTAFTSNIQKTNYEGNISKDIDDIKTEMHKLNQKFIPKNSPSICFQTQKNKNVIVALDPQAIATGLVAGGLCAGIAYYVAKK